MLGLLASVFSIGISRLVPVSTCITKSMATKRPPDDDPNLVSKIQRIEHQDPLSPQHRPSNNNDFSGSVKKKLADSKRTGQACDRCKVRLTHCNGGDGDGCFTKSMGQVASHKHFVAPATSLRRAFLLHVVQQTNKLTTTTGAQDPLRRPTRRMHTMRAEQDAMSHHRPNHRTRHSTRPRGGHGVGELVPARPHR